MLLERQADEIIAAYQAGQDFDQLSEQFIAGKVVLRRLLRNHGIPIREKERPRPRYEQVSQAAPDIIAAYQRGAPVTTIAQHHKTSPKIIQQILNEHQIQRPPKPLMMTVKPPTKRERALAQADVMMAKYQAGEELEQIAADLKISRYMLLYVLRSNNIPLRPLPRKPRKPRKPSHPYPRPRLEDMRESAADIIADYQRGVSINRLVQHYKTSPPIIKDILHEHQVPPYQKPVPAALPPTAEEQAIIAAYQQKTLSISVLVQTFSISRHQLYQLLDRQGIERRLIRKNKKTLPL